MELGLSGKSCIVTGGSQGIGLAVARRLTDEGARVLLVARSADTLTAVTRELGERAAALALDITRDDAPDRIAEAASDHAGDADVLVNNAGLSAYKPLETLTAADYQEHFDISVLATLRLMQRLVPGMAARGDGAVVNVASIAGRRPSPTNPAYSAAKAAELNLTRAYADHYARRGVRINAVNPGPVSSPLWAGPGGLADQHAAARGITPAEVMAQVSAATPQGRYATPEEIAAIVVFLCSAQAANVVGAGWQVDGGAYPMI